MILRRRCSFGLALALLASGAPAVLAQTKALPKGSATQSTKVTATVTAIDQKNRVITLKTPDGLDYTFVVDPAVKNLPQVKVGDSMVATYTEALAYEVKKGGTASATETLAGGTAEPGKKPAGALARQVTLTVSIAAIDPTVPSVTFKGPQGNTRTVKVRDPKKLEGVSVGDTVQITYTEALALKLEKAESKK